MFSIKKIKIHVKHFKAHIPVSWFSLQLINLLISQLFLLFFLFLAPVPAIATVTMLSLSSCPCYSHTCLSQIALAISSLLTTFRLLLSLLRTLENASGYFSLISTIKLLPAMEQSCPQFTHEPSSILYLFGMK